MGRWGIGVALAALLVSNPPNPWGQVTTPSHGIEGPIGDYDAGCIDGALPLPDTGLGYQVMRLSRHRYYGHLSLLGFLTGLGAQLAAERIGPILIGDMGLPRGGPMPTGHLSHQIGLDVDIWYWLDPVAAQRPLTNVERETLSAPAYVDIAQGEINRDLWGPDNVRVLKLVTSRPEVERVFVNPIIKQELCETEKNDTALLHKLRPWFLHHDHFHVRLHCPKLKPGVRNGCVEQAPIPAGDGCNELDTWLSDDVRAQELQMLNEANDPNAPENPVPRLPKACARVLTAP